MLAVRAANPSSRSTSNTTPLERSSATKRGTPYATQRITAADLRSGQIRIPSRSTSLARTLFPPHKAIVNVLMKGKLLQASWNPRTGPDRKRSGVLRLGRALRDLVREDEVLTVSAIVGIK